VPLPAESAMLLVPLVGESRPGQFDEIQQEAGSHGARVYRYGNGRSTYLVFCSLTDGTWTFGRWSSDARLFFCRMEDGHLKQMTMIRGRFAKWQDKTLIAHPQPVDRFEWIYSQGKLKTFSSTSIASEYALDDNFGVLDPVR
jgi:hypothetical protein